MDKEKRTFAFQVAAFFLAWAVISGLIWWHA